MVFDSELHLTRVNATAILAIFMDGLPRMRPIFRHASIFSTMKYISNQDLSILIIYYLIVPIGFLHVLSTICSVVIVASIWRSLILFTTDNYITFTLETKFMSAFPTSIVPMDIGNMTAPGSASLQGRVCWMILQFSSSKSYGVSISFSLA